MSEQGTTKEMDPWAHQFLWEQQQRTLAEANPLLARELEREWKEDGTWLIKPRGSHG